MERDKPSGFFGALVGIALGMEITKIFIELFR
jgi:hypothetical protein